MSFMFNDAAIKCMLQSYGKDLKAFLLMRRLAAVLVFYNCRPVTVVDLKTNDEDNNKCPIELSLPDIS